MFRNGLSEQEPSYPGTEVSYLQMEYHKTKMILFSKGNNKLKGEKNRQSGRKSLPVICQIADYFSQNENNS